MKKTISRKGAKLAKNTPTKAEAAAVKQGREAFKRGEYVTLGALRHDLDATRQQARKKRS